MKSRVTGFRLAVSGNNPDLESFLEHLTQLPSGTVNHRGKVRTISVGVMDDFFVGLVLTIRDARAFCQASSAPGGLRLSVARLAEGTSIFEFNYFLVHGPTGQGVYQSYHHSCGESSFANFLASFYSGLKARLIAQCEAEQMLSRAEQRIIRQRHSGRLVYTPVVRQGDLGSILSEWRRVSSFVAQVDAVAGVQQEQFRPLAMAAKTQSYKFTFTRNARLDQVILGIESALERGNLRKARVAGTDAEGVPRIINVFDDRPALDESDLDRLLEMLADADFGMHDPATSPLVPWLRTVYRRHFGG